MYQYNAKVKRVVDGDTVDFEVDLGFSVKIDIRGRLLNVDTPERGHPDWKLATKTCANLLYENASVEVSGDDEDLHVVIQTQKTGKYGRWLVYIDGVNDELEKVWPYE